MSPVTLAGIEKAAAKIEPIPASNYLAMYGITNPWTLWILRRESRLLELPSEQIAGWNHEAEV